MKKQIALATMAAVLGLSATAYGAGDSQKADTAACCQNPSFPPYKKSVPPNPWQLQPHLPDGSRTVSARWQ